MLLRILLAAVLWAISGASPALAQEVVTSAGPDSVAVTIYRAPDRAADRAMNLGWLEGYALVTEKRTVEIPAGRAVIRFEGVAGGMLPESALVSGLPEGVVEKNLDADLLSPGNLYARNFGRPVLLRRVHEASGAVHEERAIVRSGPAGSVIVQTREGFETANCGVTQDQLVFDGVPAGLSARPTLSVETAAKTPARVTIALSYLSWGFDWQANYVLKMAEGGRTADMFGWVTLANSDATSFADADTSVVGGKVNREDRDRSSAQGQSLRFRCYFSPMPQYAPAAPPAPIAQDYGEIILTAARAPAPPPPPPPVMVREEGLGDLKLYRVPMPTTVASMAQKQVAMFQLSNVRVQPEYVADFWSGNAGEIEVKRHLKMRNVKQEGLGRALPAGQAVVFEPFAGQSILSGEGTLDDAAVGQDVDLTLGDATQVTAAIEELDSSSKHPRGRFQWQDLRLTVRNANPWPVRFVAKIRHDGDHRIEQVSARVERLGTLSTWRKTVRANSTARMEWRQIAIEH